MTKDSGSLILRADFFDRLNETVFLPVLGEKLSHSNIADIVDGMGDVIFRTIYDGDQVMLGKLGMFKPHIIPSAKRWNPKKQEHFQGKERKKVSFKQSQSTKTLMG